MWIPKKTPTLAKHWKRWNSMGLDGVCLSLTAYNRGFHTQYKEVCAKSLKGLVLLLGNNSAGCVEWLVK